MNNFYYYSLFKKYNYYFKKNMGSILVCAYPGENNNIGNIEIYINNNNGNIYKNKKNVNNEKQTLENNDIINNKIIDKNLYYKSCKINNININNSFDINSINDKNKNTNQLKNNSSFSDSIIMFNKKKSISPSNNPLDGLVRIIPKTKNNI